MNENLNRLREIVSSDQDRMIVLQLVRELSLPDCWVGAGFVRNAAWDVLHGLQTPLSEFDIDVIYWDPDHASETRDLSLGWTLRKTLPLQWEVVNQARTHLWNNDDPYHSCHDAISKWTETATSVAVRLNSQDDLEFLAPFGVDDIFELVIRPTPHFGNRPEIVRERALNKNWLDRWNKLRLLL